MVDASDATGAKFVTRDGRFVRRRVEATTLASSGAVDQPPLDGGAAGRPNAVPSASLPDDVTCRLCQNLLVHAVAFTCCQGLACATCAEKATQTALEAWQRRLGAMESRAGGMLEEDDDNDDDVAEGAAGGPTCPLCFGHLRVEGDVVLPAKDARSRTNEHLAAVRKRPRDSMGVAEVVAASGTMASSS